MFLLHALATKRKQLEEAGDVQGLQKLPNVTVFEKAAEPGGVWRSNRHDEPGDHPSNGSTNMYEGLWINGPKDAMEFFDYTYEEHFESLQPVFLPRKHVVEYLMARVTKHENIFEKVRFNTEIKFVEYDDEEKRFVIRIKSSDGESVEYFDKCVWAGGMNGKPYFVPSIMEKLSDFKGKIVHSAGMNKLSTGDTNAVKGKNILMVGDSYSAEDLTLQCIKLGANEVNITTRRCSGIATEMGSWPEDKVDIHYYAEISGIKKDGTGKTVLLKSKKEEEYPAPVMEDIDIIILCTGYRPNDDILAKNLQPFAEWEGPDANEECWEIEEAGVDRSTWRMKENALTAELGHIEPCGELEKNCDYIHQGCYRKLLIENPNMMFIYESCDLPLLDIDVCAWGVLGYLTGERKVPTSEEMKVGIMQDLLKGMDEHQTRYDLDENYQVAVDKLHENHWYHDHNREEFKLHFNDLWSDSVNFLGREMRITNYPLQITDENGNFNKVGDLANKMNYDSYKARLELEHFSEEEQMWRTFRDCDPSPHVSFFTGNGSIPLRGRWMEIDDEGSASEKN